MPFLVQFVHRHIDLSFLSNLKTYILFVELNCTVLCALQSIQRLTCLKFLRNVRIILAENNSVSLPVHSFHIHSHNESQTTQKILVWLIITTHVTRRNWSEKTTTYKESRLQANTHVTSETVCSSAGSSDSAFKAFESYS